MMIDIDQVDLDPEINFGGISTLNKKRVDPERSIKSTQEARRVPVRVVHRIRAILRVLVLNSLIRKDLLRLLPQDLRNRGEMLHIIDIKRDNKSDTSIGSRRFLGMVPLEESSKESTGINYSPSRYLFQ